MKELLVFICFVHLYDCATNLTYPNIQPKQPVEEVPAPEITQQDVVRALDYAVAQAKKRIEEEDIYLKAGGRLEPTKVSALLRAFGLANPTEVGEHRVQMQLEDATKYIVKKYGLSESETTSGLPKISLPENHPLVEQCRQLLSFKPCNATSKYRTADGSCNNLKHPNWGRAMFPYTRLTSSFYTDGISSPRMSKRNTTLPSARLLSAKISTDVNVTSKRFTVMLMSFAQVINHDFGLTLGVRAGTANDTYNCCLPGITVAKPSTCWPIEVPKDDPFHSKRNQTCINFVRALTWTKACNLGNPRTPLNHMSSLIDGTVFYGISDEETRLLRLHKGGRLLTQSTPHGELLPPSPFPEIDQCSGTLEKGTSCFFSGDFRANLQPGFIALNTIFVRRHNRIADILSSDYPDADDEMLFQETRRIMVAEMQMITYNAMLHHLIGRNMTEFFSLDTLKEGYTTYQPEVDASASLENSAAAYRFGHTLVQNMFNEVNKEGVTTGYVDMTHSQLGVFPSMFYQGKMDDYVRGNIYQGPQEFDRHFVQALTNHLLDAPGESAGLDLVSTGIQRGRDVGLPPYAKMVEHCYGIRLNTFDDFTILIPRDDVESLKQLYSDPEDVDLYVAGFMETHVEGGLVGPTFACVIGQQFHNLKFGDRFYFEHGNQAGSFSPGQLKEIRRVTLARIICDNADDINQISPDVFLPIDSGNPLTDCSKIQKPDYKKWLDK